MAKIDLNIVDRGMQGTDWIAQDTGLTAGNLNKVMEQKTDNNGALNSLPTPFARFFVAREAFRRVADEHLYEKNEAGKAYRQLVSDILDVYELLFNLKYHRNNSWKNGEKLEIREWDSTTNLDYIKKKMPVLYNSLADYYKTDIAQDKLYFVVFTDGKKDKLLACSSPITGFVTPPDLDKMSVTGKETKTGVPVGELYKNLHIRRKSGGQYFRDIKLFEDRDADFKNYMYNTLFGSDKVAAEYKVIKDYIRDFNTDPDIVNNYQAKMNSVKTDNNNDLEVNGLKFMYYDEEDIMSFFTPSIIRVPYRIDRNKYQAVDYQNDSPDRDYDFLLPFMPKVMGLFEGGKIDSCVHVNHTDSVTVKLTYKGKEYKKVYDVDGLTPGGGRILDLKTANINFDLGLFPNILSPKEKENNYFKIMVVAADEDPEAPNFNIDKISLSFFKGAGDSFMQIREVDPDTDNATFGVKPAVVRSRQKTKTVDGGTKFYELFNSSFDMVEVNISGETGLLMPVWNKSQQTNDTFTYAIDLGTSNTFMSRCKNDGNGQPDLSKRPELFTIEKPIVSYMHEVPEDKQTSLSHRIEDSFFEKAQKPVKTEFLPAIIDGSYYKFPIRTAICGIRGTADEIKLFDNHNIAFFYEKMMANDDQEVLTNVKWEEKSDLLRVFIRELLLIIKCDILQHNGDLSRTHLVWFRPLSFMGKMRTIYNELWKTEAANILFIDPKQISCYSESEAPYYYFKKNDDIKDSKAVSVIDIGGGSTDFVYFEDNHPKIANSVHFGCDVLWENGYNAFENNRDNGIYRKYAGILHFKKRKDLEDLNDSFKIDVKTTTKDIINFWLSNSACCDIKKLMEDDFKPVFVYHLTSILFYMASMYKDNGLDAPRTIVFSGNGSRYIDDFISSDPRVLKELIDMVLSRVYGGEHDVNLELPKKRKESTCYGGLYRDRNAEDVPETVYQGDKSKDYENVGDINANYATLKEALLKKYDELNKLYEDILNMLKKEKVIDNMADINKYVVCAEDDMGTPFDTYYKTQVKEKYPDEVQFYDSVFFIPVVNRIFEMTKL